MDPSQIKSWADGTKAAFDAIKMAIGLLPSGKKKEEAERLLTEAMLHQKQAEAELANKLGFRICEHCWPPEIMVRSPTRKRLECRKCGQPTSEVEQEEARQEALSEMGRLLYQVPPTVLSDDKKRPC